MSHHRIHRSHRRPRGRWTSLDWAASVSISAFWHLLVLAVLTLAVHPFQLPDANRPVDLELLPPLTPPLMPRLNLELRPRQEEPAPPPEPQVAPPLRQAAPEAQPQPQETQLPPPQPQPLEQTRPSESALAKPVEIQKRAVQPQRLQTQQALPKVQELPPEPVTVTRPDAVLAPPIDAPRAQAPSRPAPLDTSRAAPQVTPQTPGEAETLSTAPPVLTNDTVVQAPVEVRPRAAAPAVRNLETEGVAPPITAANPGASAAAPSGEAGAPAAGGRPAASKLPPGTLEGFRNAPVLRGGVGANFGCADPDAYRLTPEQRAACLDQFARQAKRAPDLGLNIPARKQAEYDHDVVCHKATLAAIPGSAEASRGTSIPGMGSGPTLKECGPGER